MAKNNKQDGGCTVLDKFMGKTEKLPVVKKKVKKAKTGNKVTELEESLELSGKTKKKDPRLNEAQAKFLEIQKKEPNRPYLDIGRELVELGFLTNERSVYGLVKNNALMQRVTAKTHADNARYLTEEVAPLALKETKKNLEDKKMKSDKKFKWAKLGLDKEFQADESKRAVFPTLINVETLNLIQNQQLKVLENRKNEMIEAQEGEVEVVDKE